MASEGGPLSVVGITPAYLSGPAKQTLSSGAQVALGQVWQGSGKSFATKVGQQLTGALTDSAVNIAVNALTGKQVENVGGILLDSGKEVLASSLTQYLTGPLASEINNSIGKSLESAGPFGPVLSSAANSLVSTALGGIGGAIGGAIPGGGGGVGGVAGGNATNYKMFPGGGDEPPADYGGNAYTLEDVVFSIQPANQGPQTFGDAAAAFDPKIGTKLPFGDLINADFGVDYPLVNDLKESVMQGNFLGDVISTNTGLA